MSASDEALTAWLLTQRAAGVEQPGGLDEDLLTGYAEGRLTREERDVVEARLAADPEARTLLGAVRARHQAAPTARRLWFVPVAGAALLLAGLGLGIHLAGRSGNPTDREPGAGDPARQFARLATELRTAHPDLLGDLQPLDADTLAAGGAAPKRGTLRALGPTGSVLSGAVRFSWRPAPGIERYEVSVVDAEGEVVWKGAATTSPAGPSTPPLAPGSYVWDVAAEGPVGRLAAEQAFVVVEPAARARYLEARALLRSLGPTGLLAEAHLAIRRELYAEALDAVRRCLAAHPTDALGLATLAFLQRRRPSR